MQLLNIHVRLIPFTFVMYMYNHNGTCNNSIAMTVKIESVYSNVLFYELLITSVASEKSILEIKNIVKHNPYTYKL